MVYISVVATGVQREVEVGREGWRVWKDGGCVKDVKDVNAGQAGIERRKVRRQRG